MDPNPSSLADKPAAYSFSCANCAQSKRKCIVRAVGGPCQRCYKTSKECTPAKTVRRRGVAKKSAATSQTSRLEEKIDSLVSLMKFGGQNGVPLSPVVNSLKVSSKLGNSEKDLAPTSEHRSSWNCPDGDQSNRSTPLTIDLTYSPGLSDICSHESEECLNHFRTFKLEYFPFIYIPFEKSAGQLRQERPFLWLCIMAISTKCTARQHALGLKIRQIIAQEIVVQSNESIDLLLGLLTFIGWASYQFHQFHPKPFLSAFTHLATSLVFDLGLNKPVQTMPSNFNLHRSPRPSSTPRTMEERRAVMGCYLITSIKSSFLQKIETFRWTTHLDECLQILDEQKECANDEILIQLVKMRLIIEKNRTHQGWLNDTSDAARRAENGAALFSDMKVQIFKSLPRDVLLLHLYSDELEITIFSLSLTPTDLKRPRLDHLFHALTSINSWFETLLMIPPSGYVSFTFPVFSQISRCLLVLYRLATLDAPNWDKTCVQQTTNPLSILNRLLNNLEQVPTAIGIDNSNYPNGDIFSRSAQILRSLRPEWEAKLGFYDMAPIEPSPYDFNGVNLPDASFFGDDSLYDGWLMELMSSTF